MSEAMTLPKAVISEPDITFSYGTSGDDRYYVVTYQTNSGRDWVAANLPYGRGLTLCYWRDAGAKVSAAAASGCRVAIA